MIHDKEFLMKKITASLMACVFLASSYTLTTNACTEFRLTAKDGTVLITRSMEFGMDFKSHLRSSNRNRDFKTSVNSKPGISWQAKYGYLFLNGLGQDVVIDGMNEAGL